MIDVPIQVDYHLNDAEDTMIIRLVKNGMIPRKNDYVHLNDEPVLYQVNAVTWHHFEDKPIHVSIELGRAKIRKTEETKASRSFTHSSGKIHLDFDE